jgi:preprotein translocase subunit YajC
VIIGASGGGGSSFILILVIGLGVVYLLFVRPQKKRRMQQEQIVNELRVGDEVLTAGGIYGTIAGLDDDLVTVEIAPGTEVKVARRAIAGVTPDPDDEEAADDEDAAVADEDEASEADEPQDAEGAAVAGDGDEPDEEKRG